MLSSNLSYLEVVAVNKERRDSWSSLLELRGHQGLKQKDSRSIGKLLPIIKVEHRRAITGSCDYRDALSHLAIVQGIFNDDVVIVKPLPW